MISHKTTLLTTIKHSIMDSYNYFDCQKIGFSASVILPCGTFEFTKISLHQYCVVNYAKNCEPFVYSKLSTVLTTIEASNLYDSMKKYEYKL